MLHYCFASVEMKLLQITKFWKGNFWVLQRGGRVQLWRSLGARTRPSGGTPGLSTFALPWVFQRLNISEAVQINSGDDCALLFPDQHIITHVQSSGEREWNMHTAPARVDTHCVNYWPPTVDDLSQQTADHLYRLLTAMIFFPDCTGNDHWLTSHIMNRNDAEAGLTCVGNESQCMEHTRGAGSGAGGCWSKDCIHLEPVLCFNNNASMEWYMLA